MVKLPSVPILIVQLVGGGPERLNRLRFHNSLVADSGPAFALCLTPAHIVVTEHLQNPTKTECCEHFFFSLDTIFLLLWYIWFICLRTLAFRITLPCINEC